MLWLSDLAGGLLVLKEKLVMLHIEDDPADAELMRRATRGVGHIDIDVLLAQTLREASHVLNKEDVDVICLDYRLGKETGLEFLRRLRASGDFRPVVVVTGAGSEYAAVDLVRAGADEYVTKSDLSSELLERALRCARDRGAQRRLEQGATQIYQALAEANVELSQSSRIDPLTRLLNRAAWDEIADLICAQAQHSGQPYVVIMLDVDHFKLYNDTFGHAAGDECLQAIAKALVRAVRGDDVVGRFGGEEFVIISPSRSEESAVGLAEGLRQAVWEMNIAHPKNAAFDRVTVSVGFALGTELQWSDVREKADQALYAAKESGRNRCACVGQPDFASQERSQVR